MGDYITKTSKFLQEKKPKEKLVDKLVDMGGYGSKESLMKKDLGILRKMAKQKRSIGPAGASTVKSPDESSTWITKKKFKGGLMVAPKRAKRGY